MKGTVFIKVGENGIGFVLRKGESFDDPAIRRKLSNSAGLVVEVDREVLPFLATHSYKIVDRPAPKAPPQKVEAPKEVSKPKTPKKSESKPDSSTAAIPTIGQSSKGD